MSIKPKWNLALDALIAAAFMGTAVSGLVFFFNLVGRGSTAEVLLLTRDGWRALHDWFGLAMIAGVGIHLLVHWKWIVNVALRQVGLRGRRPQPAATAGTPDLACARVVIGDR